MAILTRNLFDDQDLKLFDFRPDKVDPAAVLHMTGYPGRGNKVFDLSRHNNHGAITGATWARLPSGQDVLSYDGDDKTSLGTSDLLQPSNITLVAWVKRTASWTSSRPFIWTKNTDVADTGWFIEFLYNAVEANNCPILFYCDGNNQIKAGAGTFLNDFYLLNTFTQIIVTFNSTTNAATAYKNGVALTTATRVGTPDIITGNTNEKWIGWNGATYNTFTSNIVIGKISIHNGIFSQAQVSNSFNQDRHLFNA